VWNEASVTPASIVAFFAARLIRFLAASES
jgi:hypothetical protein